LTTPVLEEGKLEV